MKRFFLDRMSMMAVLFLLPMAAQAQDGTMSFSEEEVEEAAPAEEAAPSSDEGSMSFSEMRACILRADRLLSRVGPGCASGSLD